MIQMTETNTGPAFQTVARGVSLSFGADGSANYSELDATISYVVRQGCCGTVTAYGRVENSSDEPSIEDIRVEKIDGFDVSLSDVHTVEAVLGKFETGDDDAAMLAEAMTAQDLAQQLVQALAPDQGESPHAAFALAVRLQSKLSETNVPTDALRSVTDAAKGPDK